MGLKRVKGFKDMHLKFDVRDHTKLKKKKEKEREKRGLKKLVWEDIVFYAIMRL